MRMPRGRCDTQAANRSIEISRQVASSESARSAAHYNRLDISLEFHHPHLALCPRPKPVRSAAPANGGHYGRARAKSAGSSQKLFLVHGGPSCNKQVSGVTTSRKGNAR
jgi:hypothetical protein